MSVSKFVYKKVGMEYGLNTDVNNSLVTVSVVSHGQAHLVQNLINDLLKCCRIEHFILTYNIPEQELELSPSLANKVTVIRNKTPKGFGANHNAAFNHCETDFYCVVNPDIRIVEDPFSIILDQMKRIGLSLSAPLIRDFNGKLEDSFRKYPTPLLLILRKLGVNDNRWPFDGNTLLIKPDWFAGMFMIFERGHFEKIGGFDEKYFMYCEDIDICARTWKIGSTLGVITNVSVMHDARRDSSRNYQYMKWHIKSMLRFWIKNLMALPSARKKCNPP